MTKTSGVQLSMGDSRGLARQAAVTASGRGQKKQAVRGGVGGEGTSAEAPAASAAALVAAPKLVAGAGPGQPRLGRLKRPAATSMSLVRPTRMALLSEEFCKRRGIDAKWAARAHGMAQMHELRAAVNVSDFGWKEAEGQQIKPVFDDKWAPVRDQTLANALQLALEKRIVESLKEGRKGPNQVRIFRILRTDDSQGGRRDWYPHPISMTKEGQWYGQKGEKDFTKDSHLLGTLLVLGLVEYRAIPKPAAPPQEPVEFGGRAADLIESTSASAPRLAPAAEVLDGELREVTLLSGLKVKVTLTEVLALDRQIQDAQAADGVVLKRLMARMQPRPFVEAAGKIGDQEIEGYALVNKALNTRYAPGHPIMKALMKKFGESVKPQLLDFFSSNRNPTELVLVELEDRSPAKRILFQLKHEPGRTKIRSTQAKQSRDEEMPRLAGGA